MLASSIIALDASLGLCSAAWLADRVVAAERVEAGGRGQIQRLAPMLADVLARMRSGGCALDAVAVTLGPGSFTGIRAALALAHGLALASGVPLLGVDTGEALAAAVPQLQGRALWVAIDGRRGRVFLDRGDGFAAWPLAGLPTPTGPVAVAGDAAAAVAARLAARGCDTRLTDARQPLARHVAAAALDRLAAGRPPRPLLPLYVDPPAVTLPAAA